MMKPRKQNSHKELLSKELLAEYEDLSRQAPTFGQTAPEGYKDRAAAYNQKCKELGATLMMVVED